MSYAERLHDKIKETREYVFERDNWQCVVCGKPATQCGHILAQSDLNLDRWGEEIIQHPANMLAVCGLKCNDRVEISSKSRPIDAARHAAVIAALLRRAE